MAAESMLASSSTPSVLSTQSDEDASRTAAGEFHRSLLATRACLLLLALTAGVLTGCSLQELPEIPAICGDGVVEGAEECDDGNTIEGDGCSAQCLRVGTGSEGLCSNGLDDDDDTLFDCNDPDCADDSACTDGSLEICSNALDDDEDQLIDCSDPDCAGAPACGGPGERICDNERDDDDDGEVDCADDDCTGRACGENGRVCASAMCVCPTGAETEMSCTDGLDDDCDGLFDCQDPDCAGEPTCANAEQTCDDGIDNDGNGAADCADTNCINLACGPNGRICQQSSCRCPGGATEMRCSDGFDNDCDGDIDCADDECEAHPTCMGRESPCDNGVDDDGDGDVDCEDADCAGALCGPSGLRCEQGLCSCPGGQTETVCDNIRDDDCDGMIDCADDDCDGSACGDNGLVCIDGACGCAGGDTELVCDDGEDGDCDGVADCDDPDCSSEPGCSEITCDDDIDNDGDGDVDCDDTNCDTLACDDAGRRCMGQMCVCPGGDTEALCGDGTDDDCDGDVDCADSDCTSDPACAFVCEADVAVLCNNAETSASTSGLGNDVETYGCAGVDASGPERIYVFQASTDSTVTATVRNPTADIDLYALTGEAVDGGCQPGACDASSTATSGDESVIFSAVAGETYYFSVDGKNGASGEFDFVLGCDGGSSCAASFSMGCGFAETYTTAGTDATDNVDTYGCRSWDESGPEYTYAFTSDSNTQVTVALASAAELDVIVLSAGGDGACKPLTECIAQGVGQASFQAQADELYYVVVDGFLGASGEYSINVTCN